MEHILFRFSIVSVPSFRTIDSVDQYLNIKLGNVEVVNKEQYPHLVVLTVNDNLSESR